MRLTEFPIITEKRITADGKVERTRSFPEQWLEVDLGGICVVSEIKVDFFARLYGDFRVEVSDSNAEDAVWTTIATADMPEGTDLNL